MWIYELKGYSKTLCYLEPWSWSPSSQAPPPIIITTSHDHRYHEESAAAPTPLAPVNINDTAVWYKSMTYIWHGQDCISPRPPRVEPLHTHSSVSASTLDQEIWNMRPCFSSVLRLDKINRPIIALFLETGILLVLPPARYFFNYIQGSRIAFYESYIHSRTMYLAPVERAWTVDSNHTKYSKSPNIDIQGFRNKVQW